MPARCAAEPTYQRRQPERTVLYRTVQAHLKTFLGQTAADAERSGLPGSVKREFDAYLRYAARCREVGIAAYLTKPITQSELLDALLATLGTAVVADERAPLVARRSLRESRRRLRVLVAEDNPVNQRLAVHLLERHGHTVVVVGDGRAAVESLAREPFDLVLMDVQMPEMDGFEATAVIRQREAEWLPGPDAVFAPRRAAIIAVTAYAVKGDEEKCLSAGMDGYLAKPIKAEALVALIERLLPAEAAPVALSPPPPVDLAIALRAVGGDRELLAELARLFVEDCPRRLAGLREALGAGDAMGVHRAAHAVRGAVATFGAEAAQGLAVRLETLGWEGRLEEALALVTALEAELARMTAFLGTPGRIGEASYSLGRS